MARHTGHKKMRAASGSRDRNRAQAAQRLQRKQGGASGSGDGAAGPSSVLAVYDYVANGGDAAGPGQKGKKRKRADRATRRATAGFQDAAGEAEGPTRAGKRRRRDDDDEGGQAGDDDDDDDHDEELSDSERVKAPAIFSDDEGGGGGGQEFDGEDEDIDSDEAFGESDEERFEGWAFSGSKSRRDEDDEEDEEEEDDDDEDGVATLDQVLDAVPDDDDDDEDEDDEDDGEAEEGFETVQAETAARPSAFDAFPEAADVPDGGSGPVTLDDLLAPLNDPKMAGASAIYGKTSTLSAPLPAILQDRVDRAAAYEATRAQVEGWQPTLKRLREAEHLSFPLQKPAENKSSNASLVASMLSTKRGAATRSALETQTADLLRAAEMTDAQISKREDLAMNKLDPEQAEARRRELARMRELMFRAEQKAKRVSKIKSKSYRRIARKEKEKLKQKMAEAGLALDGGDDEDGEVDYEAEQAERVKAERERARERATLKHKNTGQWAKTMSGRRERDEDTNAALNDQFRRGEELRKRIQDEDSDDEDDEDEGEDSDEGEGSDAEGPSWQGRVVHGKSAFDEPAGPRQSVGALSGGVSELFKKPARKAAALDEDDNAEDDFERTAQQGVVGRVFHVSGAADDSSSSSSKRAVGSLGTGVGASSRKTQEKPLSRAEAARRAAADDARVEIDDGALPLASSSTTGASTSKATSRGASAANRSQAGLDSDVSDSDEDGDGVVAVVQGSKGKAKQKGPGRGGVVAFTQRDLVAEAFAGDDVAAQFAEEKRALVEADAPKEEDNSLPGWGSWSGKGVKHTAAQRARLEANRKKHTRTLPGLDPSKRKDAGMGHVIINERADKKVERYKVKDLPHPFTSAAQYDLVMRNAVGPEWNTRTQHQRMTLPRVVTKPGKAIQPIERKF